MDNSKLTGAIFIDLSKAFDTISHNSILEKLPNYGITGRKWSFFADYFNRWQHVSYKSALSTNKSIFCGVPQGSILGPILFLLHFNEIEKQLDKCKILMYADDTEIYYHHNDIKTIEKTLLNDFNQISNWMEDNELILNLKKGKTEVTIFGTKSRLSNVDQINVMYWGNTINCTESYKYLGVNLDPTLNLGNHFHDIYKNVSSRIRLLHRICPQLTAAAAARVYQALIVPIITYCSLKNFFCQPYSAKLLELLGIRARNIIKYKVHKFLTIQQLHHKILSSTVHKALNGELPCYDYNYFDVISHQIPTRNNKYLLRVLKIKLQSTRKTFYFDGAIKYYKLPLQLRSISERKTFFKKLNDNILTI